MEDQVHSMEDKIHKNRVRNFDRKNCRPGYQTYSEAVTMKTV